MMFLNEQKDFAGSSIKTPTQIRLASSPPMKSRMGMEGDSEGIHDALMRQQSKV